MDIQSYQNNRNNKYADGLSVLLDLKTRAAQSPIILFNSYRRNYLFRVPTIKVHVVNYCFVGISTLVRTMRKNYLSTLRNYLTISPNLRHYIFSLINSSKIPSITSTVIYVLLESIDAWSYCTSIYFVFKLGYVSLIKF